MTDALPVVTGTPDEVRERLSNRLLVLRSLWFPTPRELRAWSASGVPAYVRWLPDDGIEVGPRLESMWAACFSPVLRGRLEPVEGGTRLAWRQTWPRFTLAVLGLWTVALVAWLVVMVLQGLAGVLNPGAILWWSVLALATLAGPGLGHTFGRPALEEAERWVRTTASVAVEEDW